MSKPLATIQELTRYRWTMPVMAELWESDGCKFITLVRKLGASDKAIRQSLDYLLARGWVMRNPGYGHPWRPEYLLTEAGVGPGKTAAQLVAMLGEEKLQLGLGRWPLTLIAVLGRGPKRNSGLKRLATPITPRALALSLRELVGAGLVFRSVSDESPPAVTYSLSREGEQLAAVLQNLDQPTDDTAR